MVTTTPPGAATTPQHTPSPEPRSRTTNATVSLAAAAIAGALLLALPAPPGMPPLAQRAGALFVTALILWVTEAVPIAITALLAIVLQPILGLAPAGSAFASFMSPVFFFVLVMFVIAQAFTAPDWTAGLRAGCWRRPTDPPAVR